MQVAARAVLVFSGQVTTMRTGPGEPAVDQWRAVAVGDFVEWLKGKQPRVVAVDGRSGGGKSTLAGRLAAEVAGAVIVHVDDVAWNAPLFGWSELLAYGVLEPLRRGESVSYRPPAWDERGRSGAVAVPADASLVIVEGVGAGRRELTAWIDVLIWVQSDYAEAERRGIARDISSGVNGDADESKAFWKMWMDAEIPFLADDRPWERADAIVAGTSPQPVDATGLLVAANPIPAR